MQQVAASYRILPPVLRAVSWKGFYQMKCQECGTLASGEDLFCGECGAILANTPPEEQASAPIPDRVAESVSPAPRPRTSFDAPRARDGRANAAFVLGIVSIVAVVAACLPLSGLFTCIAPVPGIIAIILGAIAQRDIKARGGAQEDWKRARLGMILGIVGTAIYLVMLAIVILFSLGISMLESF
jgi:hypothetical protein